MYALIILYITHKCEVSPKSDETTVHKQPDSFTKSKSKHRDIKWEGAPQWVIDSIAYPINPSTANAVYIEVAYNKGNPEQNHPGDMNPKKVAFRDMLLSFWQTKTGRSVSGLNLFKYYCVEEKST